MIEKYVILPDIHDSPGKKSKPYKAVKTFIKDQYPDEVILLGDAMNTGSLSRWNKDKRLLMEGVRFANDIDSFNEELDFLQINSKRVIMMEGNHENWVEQYIEAKPELDGILNLPVQLSLKDRGIPWHKQNTAYKVGKMYFMHGMYVGVHHAKKHLEAWGCCVCYGHTHTAQVYQTTMKMQDPIMSWGLGCLCDHAPDYMKGKPAKWVNQFAVFEINTKTGRFNLMPITIIGGKFIYNGDEYGA